MVRLKKVWNLGRCWVGADRIKMQLEKFSERFVEGATDSDSS